MKVRYKDGAPVVPKGWRKLHGNAATYPTDKCPWHYEWRNLEVGAFPVNAHTQYPKPIIRRIGAKGAK